MPVKALVLVKRRSDLSDEVFRERYDGHVGLAIKHFGHLWLDYRRNFIGASAPFAAETAGEGPAYDAIAEITFRDMAAVEESQRIAQDPQVARVLATDEERIFDRQISRIAICEVVETKLR